MSNAGARDQAIYRLALEIRKLCYSQGKDGEPLSGVCLAAAEYMDTTKFVGANLYRHAYKCGQLDKAAQ